MDYIEICLSPKEIQKFLDCLDIIPSNHYICIYKNIDNDKIYISDCGKDCKKEDELLEITCV